MSSLNMAIVLGNIGKDPEVRYTQSGDALCNFTVASNEKWKDKSGEMKEKTEWHNVVSFGRTAEVAGEYLKKGSKVLVVGRIQTRKWQDKEGNDRYTTEIVCDKLTMLGDGKAGGERAERPSKSAASKPASKAEQEVGDDIPF